MSVYSRFMWSIIYIDKLVSIETDIIMILVVLKLTFSDNGNKSEV